MVDPDVRFPEPSIWDAAASVYQVEGAVRAGTRGRSIWNSFYRFPGAIARGEAGESAADQYTVTPRM